MVYPLAGARAISRLVAPRANRFSYVLVIMFVAMVALLAAFGLHTSA